jgi:long-subunit acyl-CoA synthetase (AMP-forming)
MQITGKKASANPLETALRACPIVSEAIVFGTSRPALGALIVPASESVAASDILNRVHAVNEHSPSYARILDELVIVLSTEQARQIPKTSKGSVIRPRALTAFDEVIADAYKQLETGYGVFRDQADHTLESSVETESDVASYVRRVVCESLQQRHRACANENEKEDCGDEDDLFNAGIDSVQAVWIRSALQKVILSRHLYHMRFLTKSYIAVTYIS